MSITWPWHLLVILLSGDSKQLLSSRLQKCWKTDFDWNLVPQTIRGIRNYVMQKLCTSPGWKGPRRLMVAVREFALFSGFSSCVRFMLNRARQPGDNEWLSVKNGMMAFWRLTKFVVDLDLGCYSLGSEGSNACRVKATPWFFSFRKWTVWGGTEQYRMVTHEW